MVFLVDGNGLLLGQKRDGVCMKARQDDSVCKAGRASDPRSKRGCRVSNISWSWPSVSF